MDNLWLLICLAVIHSALCLKIIPEESEITITLNGTDTASSFIFTCIDSENITWIYPENENSNYSLVYLLENGVHKLTLSINNISYMDTGNYVCKNQLEKSESNFAERYLYVFDGVHFLAVEEDYTIIQAVENKEVIIPCRPTLPNTSVILINSEDDSQMNLKFDSKKGFFLNSPKLKDSKTVQCKVNNSEFVEEKTFSLHISIPDNNIQPYVYIPGGAIPAEGKSLTLNCSVGLKMGTHVFITWKYPNEDVKNRSMELSQQEYSDANGKVNYKLLTFFNLSKFDSGDYICVVSGVESVVVKKYTYFLNVFDSNETFLDFKITPDVKNFSLQSGVHQHRLIFNVTSHPPAIVHCKVPNGQIISSPDPTSNKYHLTLTDKKLKFVINQLEVNDTGTYEFIADNTRMKAYLNVSIYVEGGPVVQMAKKFELSLVNELSEVECIATGFPPPTITWSAEKCNRYPSPCESKRNELASSDYFTENYKGKPHVMKSTLRYQANETTILFCFAKIKDEIANSSIPFIITDVNDGFNISKSLNEITVNDDVIITCQVSKYLYQNDILWQFKNSSINYSRLENSTGVHMLSSETKFSYISVIKIPSIQKVHAGSYMCNAQALKSVAKVGEAYTKAEEVPVEVQDVVKPYFSSTTNLNGSTTIIEAYKGKHTFYCYPNGVPKPTILWFKDGVLITAGKNDSVRLSLSSDKQELTIEVPQREHAGKYTCEAKNKDGKAEAIGYVVIKGLPDEYQLFYSIILPALLTITLTTCLAWILVKMQKMKKLKKSLAADGLLNFEAGAVTSLNPELGIEEQADLLPYDSRWEFPREKLKLGKQLGAGAFGVVLKAEADGIIDPNTSTTVAVKMVKRNVDALYIRALASELKIMIHLGRHLNVVNLLGACTRDINKRELVVIVEYCKYGNLHDFLLKQRGNFINQINENGQLDFSVMENKNSIRFSTSGAVVNTSYTGTTTVESMTTEETLIGSDGYLVSKDVEPDWRSNYRGDYRNTTVRPIKTSDLLCWSFQIARGMEYLASRKVLHGDLAARNVLLADDNIVKICDFGLAKSMYASDNYKRKKNELLPVRWMAVESIRDRVFSIQSDVWSFGITMWELFSLSITPYPGVEHLEALYTKLENGYRLEKPTYATKEIHEIMLDCWHERPTMRPLFTELGERIGELLENGVRSHYTNLNEVYLQMNANTCNGVDYLSLLNPPVYSTALEEPRYVNLPCMQSRESPEPDEDVELKPMLNPPDNYVNATPLLFSNPNYMEINQPKIPAYVNSAN